MIILAIETSCDDTSVAIVSVKNGNNRKLKTKNYKPQTDFKVLANLVSSQINIHKKWGGVVPNLASRAHTKNLPIVFEKALKEAKIHPHTLKFSQKIINKKTLKGTGIKIKDIDAIAVTIGPGLSPSLLIGVHFARALAYKYNKPIIPINHIEGHICSNFLHAPLSSPQKRGSRPELNLDSRLRGNDKIINNFQFPIMNLIVSGGHTSLYLMRKFGKYQLIGETRDDAAGEAFDKVAKMLGLGYPGGPIISALAQKWQPTVLSSPRTRGSRPELNLDSRRSLPHTAIRGGNDKNGGRDNKLSNLKFPRPMIGSKDFDFSFSGLKTAVFYKLREILETPAFAPVAAETKTGKKATAGKRRISKNIKIAVAHEFQQAVIDVLISKTISAAKKYGASTIAISGGVSANDQLRKQFKQKTKENGITFVMPPKNMSTDNALMIAIAACRNLNKKTSWNKIDANPNLKLL